MRQLSNSQKCRWESWTSLHVSKCALHNHVDSWQVNQLFMKFSQKTENELFNTIWKSFSVKGDIFTQITLLGRQRLRGFCGFVVGLFLFFCLFIFLFWGGFFSFSCQNSNTDNKAIWIFLFLVTKIIFPDKLPADKSVANYS